jgi:hypothetical protein
MTEPEKVNQTVQPNPNGASTTAESATSKSEAKPDAAKTPTKEDGKEAWEKFRGMVDTNSMWKTMYNFFGGDQLTASPTAQKDNSFFADIVKHSAVIDYRDKQKNPALQDMKGDGIDSMSNNIRARLQEQFDKGLMKFDDPAKFQQLLDAVPEIVKNSAPNGVLDPHFNPSVLMRGLAAKAGELKADLTLDDHLPGPVKKVVDDKISYGQKLSVNAKDKASVDAIGFKGAEATVNSMSSNATHDLEEMGHMTPEALQKKLGDNYTVQTYSLKHPDAVNGGDSKPAVDGYFVSNGKDVGYYVTVDQISGANTKIDLSLTPEKTTVAAAPALVAEQPQIPPQAFSPNM